MIQSIGATHNLTEDSLRAQEYPKNILLGSDIDSYIRNSFINVLPYILVVNKEETTGGAYECLVGYVKDYYIWHPRGSHGTSGIRAIIQEDTKTVTGQPKRLMNTLTTDIELKELSIYLPTDSATFISEFLEFFTSKYEEYTETSTFFTEQAFNTVLDFMDLIFEELHGVHAEVIDAGQHVPSMFLWGFIKAW